MKKVNPFSILLIAVVSLTAIWFLLPSFAFYSKTPEERRETVAEDPSILNNIINLGLDLQGGMRLVLEVDRSSLSKEEQEGLLDRAYTIIENRINGLGVTEPTIQKQGESRIIVELPGLSNKEVAKQVIGSTAQLEFLLVRKPDEISRAISIIDRTLERLAKSGSSKEPESPEKLTDTSADTSEVASSAQKDTSGRDTTEMSDTENKEKNQNRLQPVTTSKGEVVTSIKDYLADMGGQIAVETQDIGTVKKILNNKHVQDALKKSGLGNSIFLWGHDEITQNNRSFKTLYYLKERPLLKGDIIKDANWNTAQSGMEAGQAKVDLELNRRGAVKFSRITGDNIDRFLAIVLDNTVYSAPSIRQKISGGRAQITGDFSPEEANALSIVLKAGALPAPVKIIEERTVGPSLGRESVIKGLQALGIGFIIVVLFILFYYKGAGVIANIALLLNIVYILAIMASFGATLTLPGIAGIILIMGMAIDSNVIIFERIREEIDIGKTVRTAIESGYSRAFLTIMDANVTTLITAFILMEVGTGPIKGFAVTMIIGILVSLFTALFLTKLIFNLITSRFNIKKLSI